MDKTKNMLVDTEEVTFIHLFYAARERSDANTSIDLRIHTLGESPLELCLFYC